MSARVSASVRKGVLGSCNRPASQAAGRAYRIVLCRGAGHEEGEKEGSKGLPRQNFSKCLLSLLPRHGVHRELPTRPRGRWTCSPSLPSIALTLDSKVIQVDRGGFISLLSRPLHVRPFRYLKGRLEPARQLATPMASCRTRVRFRSDSSAQHI